MQKLNNRLEIEQSSPDLCINTKNLKKNNLFAYKILINWHIRHFFFQFIEMYVNIYMATLYFEMKTSDH